MGADEIWTTKINGLIGNERRIVCTGCRNRTKHLVLASVERSGENQDVHIIEQYEILACCGCETIAFRKDFESSEEMHWDEESGTDYPVPHEEVFPHRMANRGEIHDAHFLPWKVRTVYVETLRAILSDQRILASLGMRVLIEAVCAEKEAKGRYLNNKIDWLCEARLVSKQDSEILQALREMGNSAAHESKALTEEELATAFDVVEHLLLGVYILPARTGVGPESPF